MAQTTLLPVRKFIHVDTDGVIYEVAIKRVDANSANVVAREIGTHDAATPANAVMYSTPSYGATEQTAVVLSTAVAAVFDPLTPVSYLRQAAIYDAADEGGAGATLSSLLS